MSEKGPEGPPGSGRRMSWFERLIPARIGTRAESRTNVPEGLWIKCDACANVLYHAELERSQDVCTRCGHHMRVRARKRIDRLLDAGSGIEIGENVEPVDVLKFKDSKRYKDRLAQSQKESGEKDALVVKRGTLHGQGVVVAVFDFAFMAGSMGSVVGERFCLGCDAALEHGVPFVCFSASGGARMQEALFSLLQMGKTSSLLTRLGDARLPYISVLTDPTMGGVSASLAMLGDLIVAEPGARIGFAGPRVIEQTVREKLPDGFQSSEFLLEHGAIDMIVDRRHMRDVLARQLAKLTDRALPASLEGGAGAANASDAPGAATGSNGAATPGSPFQTPRRRATDFPPPPAAAPGTSDRTSGGTPGGTTPAGSGTARPSDGGGQGEPERAHESAAADAPRPDRRAGDAANGAGRADGPDATDGSRGAASTDVPGREPGNGQANGGANGQPHGQASSGADSHGAAGGARDVDDTGQH